MRPAAGLSSNYCLGQFCKAEEGDFSRAPKKEMAETKKPDVEELLRERLRELGMIGRNASARKLSKKQRSANAKKAAVARWGKKKPG